MSGLSSAYANNVLTWLFTTAAAPTRPTGWSAALYTDATGLNTAPTTEATTSNCPGYARQTVSFGSAAASGGQVSNTADFAFTATGGPWATVNYIGILDQSGALIDWAPLSTSRTLQVSGDKIDWAAGAYVPKQLNSAGLAG